MPLPAFSAFKAHGIRTDGSRVYLEEDQVMQVLEMAPAQFIIHDWNHERDVTVGSGGALTDASYPDAQAGFESMLSLATTVNSGVDFVLHGGGILSAYLAFSYEKFVLDDEMCGMVRRFSRKIEVTPNWGCYLKVADIAQDELLEVVKPLVVKVLDVREM